MANRIVLKRSSVANRVPLAADLVTGELAVNLTDKLLYTKDAAGNVVTVGDGGGGGGGGTVTGVTATAPVVSSGGTAPVISMAAATTSTPGYLTAADWNTFNAKQAALGFTPYNATNPSGYISSITSANVTTALGYTPYNATNPNGYISSITSANVTTALGYTPYNATNPNGYITSSGSISGNAATSTKVNSQGNYANSAVGTTRGASGLNVYEVYSNGYPSTYGNLLHVAGGGGGQLLLGWSGTDGAHASNYVRSKRDNDSGAWSAWAELLTSANYTSYAPSLTGSGASGTWGINITGNAATINSQANSATITASSGVNGSQIVQRDGNGYIYASHINFSTSETENPTINSFLTGNGDGWSRKSSLAHVKNSIRGVADGTWGINVTGSSGSCSGNAASASSVAWGNVSSKPSSIFYYAGWATDANTVASNSSSFCYSVNAAATGPLAYFEAGGYGLQLSCGYGNGDNFYWRTRNGDNGTWQSWRRFLTEDVWINNKHFGSDGNIYSNASMRATIFYDQNDTSYFCDPNSSSTLRTITNRGWLYINENYGHSVVGTYASTRLQGVFAMGDSYKLPADGIGGGSLYGIAWSHPNAGGVAGNLNTHGALLLENGGYLCALSGSIRCRDDMRTPIYYDANDTYYYVDPNGTSRLANRLYLHNWIEFVNYTGLYSPNNGAHFYPNDASYGSWRVAGSRNGWAGLEFDASNGQQSMMVHTNGQTIGWHNNSYGWKFRWDGGRIYCYDSTYGGGPSRMMLMEDTWQNSKYFASNGDVYTHYQYDSDNTGYYIDINGTSRMNAVVADNLYAYGTVTAYYSDDRLKTRFSNIADALDKVCSLNGFFYVGNSVAESLGYKKKMEVGLSAQEVQRILPEVVVPAPVDENYLTIQYDRVVPLLVEAIKELRNELNQLKSLKV